MILGNKQWISFEFLGRIVKKSETDVKKILQGVVPPTMIFFGNSMFELVFHVITLMPNNDKDPIQIHKKKFV